MSKIEYALNIFKNVFIDITLFEFLYNVKLYKILKLLTILTKQNNDAMNFLIKKIQLCNEIYNNIKLTQAKITLIFDNKHKLSKFINFVYLKLTKIDRFNYYVSNFLFIFVKKIELFRIIKRINVFAYKLELFKNFRIYNIISIIYFEQITSNFFVKNIFSSSLLIVEKNKFYVVKKF